MNINNIFYVVLSIVSVLVTGVLIPYLRQKNLQNKADNILSAVEIAVKAAEQIYRESGQGNLKKMYVIQYLKDKGVKLTEDELDAMIESAVLELNRWKKEIEKNPPVVKVIEK